MLQVPLLALLAGLASPSRATAVPELCEAEMNKVKDLLQVSCVGKGLGSLPAGLPKDTGLLLLGSNRLGRLSLASLQHLSQLSELDLSNNSLSALESGAALPSLQVLVLSHNALEALPTFQGLPALTRLALGHNALAQLPEGAFRALGRLQDLQLQGNRLRHLPPGAFQGLGELKDLDLSDNRLEALPRELLGGLGALEILRLERNRLRNVPVHFFPEENLFAYVYLAENPWRCDCRLAYLRAWIQENEISVYTRVQGPEKEVTENEPESVKCQAPPEEKGRPVMNFQADCRDLGDSDHGGEEQGGEGEEDTGQGAENTTSTLTPPTAATTLSTRPATLSAHHPSQATATTPAAAAPTTTTLIATAPITTRFPTTTSTTASTSTQAATTTTPTTFVASPTAATTRVRSAASPTPSVPPPTATRAASRPRQAPTEPSVPFMPTTATTLPPDATLPAAGPASSTAALATPTTHAGTPPGTSAPASTGPPLTPPSPVPPGPCLCPALPVRAHGATPRRRSPMTWAGWLAHRCCPLRLALYLACLVLVVLPALPVLCCLGWLYLRWNRPASQAAPGARSVRHRLQPRVGGLPGRGAGNVSASGPPIYRVCKTFRVAPLRHVSWLLVSLPGPEKPEPWARRGGGLSAYSLDRGRDTLGAVRVRYATSSL